MGDESASNRLNYLAGCPNWHTGVLMYFRRALPIPCPRVQKLCVYGCPNAESFCTESILGIASVWVNVPADSSNLAGDCKRQQAFALDVAHAGVLTAADLFYFDVSPFLEAKEIVERNDYELKYQIGKSKASPNRKYTAFVWCEFDNQYKTVLLVTNKDGSTCCSYQFATGNEASIGQLRWEGNEQVHIPLTALGGNPYWSCNIDGSFEFVFPKSEHGSAHDVYRHATLLLDGPWVIPDHTQGTQLLKQAAAAGYKHAIRRLERSE